MHISDEIRRLTEQYQRVTSAVRERSAYDEAIRRAVEQTRAYELEYQLAIREAAQVNSVSQVIQGLSTQANLWSAVKEIADRTSGAQAVSQLALDIMRDTARWESVVAVISRQPSLTDLRVAAKIYEDSLATVTARLADIELLDRNPRVAAMILRPYEETLRVGAGMADELSRARIAHRRDALSAGLTLTADLVHASALEVVEFDDPVTDEVELIPPALNAPGVIHRELLAVRGIPATPDPSVLRPYSPAAQLAYRARRVTTLLGACNEEWELRHNEQIFRTTTAVYLAGVHLPFISVVDRQSLGSFVDNLYFMLYEGAGGEHLRYLEADLVKREECQVIWAIKALRNYHLRHDPDRGRTGDIKRKRETLMEILNWIGLTGHPRSKDDFRLVQDRLIAEVETFLERLVARLNRNPNS